jgi:aryl-alcohol dehydrogenase-like predicted oxidoreductase
MQYRNLGSSGLKVSVIGLGTNQFGGTCDFETSKSILDAALDAGINFIDTADIYSRGGSEDVIGRAIKGRPRDQILIGTKVTKPMGDGPNDVGFSRHRIMTGIDASLKRLDTDYIDLYQIHEWDEVTPVEEMMSALNDLVRMGKVRYLGCSNFNAWQMTEANGVAEKNGWTKFVTNQPHYHLFQREIEQELVSACQYHNVGILPYFPLAGGFLTGKYKRGEAAPEGSRGARSPYVQKYMTDENYDVLEKLGAFAQDHGHTINELAHAWLMAQPQISSVISGATRAEHVIANAKSAEWELSEQDLAVVNEILGGE